jgi:hypothetical protein
MPAILDYDDYDLWLDRGTPDTVRSLRACKQSSLTGSPIFASF